MAGWLRGLAAEAQRRPAAALDEIARAAPGRAQRPAVLPRAHAARPGPGGRRPRRPGAGASGPVSRRPRSTSGLGATAYADARVGGTVLRPVAASAHGLPQALGLTEREQDVLTLVASGMSYAQIARELFVTQSTVGYHLSNIYRKAQVTSRHELTELVRRDPAGFGIVPT